MIWEMYQQRKISEANVEAARATGKVQSVQDQIKMLDRKVEKMALINQAMWEILRERINGSDELILEKMHEIDLRDGVQDGKMTRSATKCKSCGRAVNKTTRKCIYCEKEIANEEVFRKI